MQTVHRTSPQGIQTPPCCEATVLVRVRVGLSRKFSFDFSDLERSKPGQVRLGEQLVPTLPVDQQSSQ